MNEIENKKAPGQETPAFTDKEIELFRKDTEGCSNIIHLNNAGASLMPDTVTKSILDHIKLEASIGGYEASALMKAGINEFYAQAGKLLNSKPSRIAFTSSATDSYSRALSSIPFKAGDVILTSNDDFISNQIQFLSCQKRFGIRVARINNAPGGGVDLNDLEYKLKTLHPRLLAITHIPTNSGLVQPVKEIGVMAKQYDAYYILDACQSIGQMKLDVEELGCDFLSVTSRKFLRGPRGAGFLYISDRVLQDGLEPLFIDMRGAEWIEKDIYKQREDAARFEDWEFAYALVLGTRYAIEYCLQIGEERIWQRVKELSSYMRAELAGINRVKILDQGPELGGLVTFTAEGHDPVRITQQLLERKINVVPSFRNFAILDFDKKKAAWAIRASPHYFNTHEEIDQFIESVKEII
jgi:selenocysteine lyase/cysteine desulfurase